MWDKSHLIILLYKQLFSNNLFIVNSNGYVYSGGDIRNIYILLLLGLTFTQATGDRCIPGTCDNYGNTCESDADCGGGNCCGICCMSSNPSDYYATYSQSNCEDYNYTFFPGGEDGCVCDDSCDESSLCDEEIEVELWGWCYNIEETTF